MTSYFILSFEWKTFFYPSYPTFVCLIRPKASTNIDVTWEYRFCLSSGFVFHGENVLKEFVLQLQYWLLHLFSFYRVCHGFRIIKWDSLFLSHFWSKHHISRQLGSSEYWLEPKTKPPQQSFTKLSLSKSVQRSGAAVKNSESILRVECFHNSKAKQASLVFPCLLHFQNWNWIFKSDFWLFPGW